MSRNTSSSRRRDGRNAFEPGVDPMDICPYTKGTLQFALWYEDFLAGWNEELKEHERGKALLEEVEETTFTCGHCGTTYIIREE